MKKLIFCTCFSFVLTSIFAQTYIGGLYYNLDHSKFTAEVTSVPYGSLSGDVIIPSLVQYNNQTYTVKTIGNNAFRGYSSLYSISLPASISSIGIAAFEGCTAMEFIVCEALTPPSVRTSTFNQVDKSIPVYVPNESIMLYIEADGWKEFINILGLSDDPAGMEKVIEDRKCIKFINNGHIYILRGDKTYTLQGAEVK